MPIFEYSDYEVPAGCTVTYFDAKVMTEFYRVTNDELGEMLMINYFLHKNNQITYDMIIEANPQYNGHVNRQLIDKIVERHPHIDISYGMWKDNKLILINDRKVKSEKWAVFVEKENKIVPIWIVGGTNFEMDMSVVDDEVKPILDDTSTEQSLLPNDRQKVPKNDGELITIIGSSGNQIYVKGMNKTAIEEQLRLDQWFYERVVVQTRGDGLCGLHALHAAMDNAGVNIEKDQLHQELNQIAQQLRQSDEVRHDWYTMEELRTVSENHRVCLNVRDKSEQLLRYWTMKGDYNYNVGLTADGYHYDWVKLDVSPSVFNSPTSPKTVTNTDDNESNSSSTQNSANDSFKRGAKSRRYSRSYGRGLLKTWDRISERNYHWKIPKDEKDVKTENLPETHPLRGLQLTENWNKYPTSLKEYVNEGGIEDPVIDYSLPTVEDIRRPDAYYTWPTKIKVNTYIPKRMDNPLIRIPDEFCHIISKKEYPKESHIHQQYMMSIVALTNILHSEQFVDYTIKYPMQNDINVLKQICECRFSNQATLNSKVTHNTAMLYTTFDLTNIMKINYPIETAISTPPSIPSILLLFQRLRICLGLNKTLSDDFNSEYNMSYHSCGSYSLTSNMEGIEFLLIVSGSLFYFHHEDVPVAFLGSVTYLDYCITFSEVKWSLATIISSSEYAWLRPLGNFMLSLSKMMTNHNTIVDFMKSYEPFLLGITDLIESGFINWAPFLDTIHSMIDSANAVSIDKITITEIIDEIMGLNSNEPKTNIFIDLIRCITHMDGIQLQEASTLHKFLFYAEVDTEKGIIKFLKRVHSPRPYDPSLIETMVQYAKQQFTLKYMLRHKAIPRMRGNLEKLNAINIAFRSSNIDRIRAEPLSWWEDIEPYDCLDDTSSHNILEVAKDKGALLPEISFGPGDSRKELLQVLESNINSYKELDLSSFSRTIQPKVQRTRSDHIKRKIQYPARLIPKEKEQKIEARLFGNAPLYAKHGLSFKMLKAKKALAYFDSEVMTKTDKDRKMRIHEMAQELNKPHAFTLLLDIEGHNQSMQGANCRALYEFVGKLFGEDDWGNLSDYFSNLTVYHYDEYYNDVIVSQGQKGGIEGWMNPLWTLHTTILTELLSVETEIHCGTCSVYSDDVAMIVNMKEVTTDALNNVFISVRDHFLRAGMIVKLSQTSVTKNRNTMLRTHYFKGQRSDSTLKRLLAASVMNNAVIISDELETSGVNSSCSSAMELSESVATITYLKWQKCVFINMRAFAALLERRRDRNNILSEHLPDRLKVLFWTEPGDLYPYLLGDPEIVKQDMINRAMDLGLEDVLLYGKNELRDFARKIYGLAPGELNLLKRRDCIYYCLTEDRWTQELLYFILTSTISLGGRGVSQAITDIISGHSDNLLKVTSYQKEWVDNYSLDREFYYKVYEAQLSLKDEQYTNISPTFLCSGLWPTKNNIYSTSSKLMKEIEKFMRRANINPFITDLLNLTDNPTIFKEKLIEAAGPVLHPRVLQFYTDHSIYYLRDLLVRKVETSSGFLSNIRNLKKTRSDILQTELFNMIRMFELEDQRFGSFNQDISCLHYLDARNKLIFHTVNVKLIYEPMYDHLLVENDFNRPLFTVVRSSVTTYKDGVKVYKPPVFGNEALYKGELIESGGLFDGIEEVLCTKLTAITQWMLQTSGVLTVKSRRGKRYSLINMCDISLSTLSRLTYLQILPYVPLAKGGEIYHRLPNMKYKTSAICRALPRSINKYTVSVHQEAIHAHNLQDSNCHFDYVTQRLRLTHVMREKYLGDSRPITLYSLSIDGTIFDVSDIRLDEDSDMPDIPWDPYTTLSKRQPKFKRINQFAKNLALNLSDTEMWTATTESEEFTEELAIGILLEQKIISYYKELKKNFMSFSYRIDSKRLWKHAIDDIRKTVDMFYELDDEMIFTIIKEKLREAKKQRLKVTNIDTRNLDMDIIKTRLRQAFELEHYTITGLLTMITKKLYTKRHLLIPDPAENIEILEHPELREYLSDYMSMKYIVLTYIIIESCGQYKVTNNNIMIERDMTIKALELFWSNPALILDNPLIAIAMRDTLFPDREEFIQLIISAEIYDEIDSALSLIDHREYIIQDLSVKIKEVNVVNPVLEHPQLIEGIKYIPLKIEWDVFTNTAIIRKILNTARFTADLYSHPIVYWSYTGSDSYTAQYSYFKSLKKMGIFQKYQSVCDLTAGRGEGHIALTRLKINHDSYFRKDIYTTMYNSGNMFSDIEYDIFKPNTLDLCEKYAFIHMDVSFTGRKNQSINSTLLHFMKNNQAFSLRLNSVYIDPELPPISTNPYNYKLLWWYPVKENLKPYQMYLLGYPTTDSIERTKKITDPAVVARFIIGNYIKTITTYNLYYLYSEDILNSSTILLNDVENLHEFVIMIQKDEKMSLLKRRLNNVINNKELLTKIIIPSSYNKYMKSDTLNHYDLAVTRELPQRYNVYANQDVGGRSEMKRKFWKKLKGELYNSDANLLTVKITTRNENLLNKLTWDHPIAKIRGLINDLLFSIQYTGSTLDAPFDKILETIGKISLTEEDFFDSSTISMRRAILLLYYSASLHNYSFGISILWSYLSSGEYSPKARVDMLKQYRRCSYLYFKFIDSSRSTPFDPVVISAIKDEILIPHLKRRTQNQSDENKSKDIKDPQNKDIADIVSTIRDSIVKNVNPEDFIKSFMNAMLSGGEKLIKLNADPVSLLFHDPSNMQLIEGGNEETFLSVLSQFDMATAIPNLEEIIMNIDEDELGDFFGGEVDDENW